jgi:tetratricopeptide (TPR) repeat protein
MLANRNKLTLTSEQHSALAATPLPFAVIWTEENFEAFTKAAERDSRDIKTYLLYLSEYRKTLADNNPVYNDKGESPKQRELLDLLPHFIANVPSEEIALYAASLNLFALLLKDTKNFTDARENLKKALQIKGLHPISMASLAQNLSSVYDVVNDFPRRVLVQKDAVEYLEEVELAHTVDMHIAASIYSSYGNALNGEGYINAALNSHTQALKLWPENNMIANRAAIFFSKQDSFEALLRAEEIFANFYDYAKGKKLFVTPFYRADVNIKLAGQARQMGNDKLAADYAKRAREYLVQALSAIRANYKGSYQSKGMARLEYLEANLAYVEDRFDDVTYHSKKAEIFRLEVDEPRAKFEKFMAKFPIAPEPKVQEPKVSFSTIYLYRRKEKAPALAPVEEAKNVAHHSLT